MNLVKKKLNFMAPFYGWGSTASRLEPLRGGILFFTTKFPEIPGKQNTFMLEKLFLSFSKNQANISITYKSIHTTEPPRRTKDSSIRRPTH